MTADHKAALVFAKALLPMIEGVTVERQLDANLAAAYLELRELAKAAEKRLDECIQVDGPSSPDEPGGYRSQWDYDTAGLCAALRAAIGEE